MLFNRCFRCGSFPIIWKRALIVPVHKKGSKSCVENYHPISILNVLSKMMERIVHNRIYSLISLSIPSQQHGFVKGRSTSTNLGLFIEQVAGDIDGGGQVDVIYTDFEKAFDRVDHIILLRKIYKLGIRGNLLRWVESYLRNRSQAVAISGHCSDYTVIPSGVPQGSILGPLLYAAYLYDVGKCFKYANYLMYADDTKVYMRIKDFSDCVNLQDDLHRLNSNYVVNRISINTGKCLSLSFSRKRNLINFDYKINNYAINKSYSTKDLGVVLDTKLLLTEHIEHITNKAYKNLGFVLRVARPFSDLVCIKLLYFSYVRSILEYCSPVWCPHYLTYVIESIQYKFVKHDYRCRRVFESYGESCKYHRLSTLEDRRFLLDMSFMHSICNGYIDYPNLLSRILSFRCPLYRTRQTQLFSIKKYNTNYAQHSLVNSP
jgi:hypothetical protein